MRPSPDHSKTRELGIRHIICVPLNLVRFVESLDADRGGRRIGVLYLEVRPGLARDGRHAVGARDPGGRGLDAIENARLYREEPRRRASNRNCASPPRFSRRCCPSRWPGCRMSRPPPFRGPCRAIGGDFFDYFGHERSVFGFTLGDVAGKGPPAALMSAMTQGMFAFASGGASTDHPASIVTTINQALCQRALEARFVTLVLGVITCDGRLTYCNAGHCPPFVVGASGVRRLEQGGPVVGLLDFATYAQDTASLEPGDAIIVFSDGVTEALNANEEEFGDSRLLDVIRRTGPDDPQSLVDAVVDAVHRHSADAVQSDDITVMAIRYLGRPAQGDV